MVRVWLCMYFCYKTIKLYSVLPWRGRLHFSKRNSGLVACCVKVTQQKAGDRGGRRLQVAGPLILMTQFVVSFLSFDLALIHVDISWNHSGNVAHKTIVFNERAVNCLMLMHKINVHTFPTVFSSCFSLIFHKTLQMSWHWESGFI